jgi:hypothetical protein
LQRRQQQQQQQEEEEEVQLGQHKWLEANCREE